MIYGYTELFCGLVILLVTLAHFFQVYPQKDKLCLSDFAVWMSGLYFGLGPFVSLIYGADIVEDALGSDIIPLYFAYLLYVIGLMLAKPIFAGWMKQEVRRAGGDVRFPLRWSTLSMARIPVTVVAALTLLVLIVRFGEIAVGGGVAGMDSDEVMENKSYLFVVLDNLGHAAYPAVLIYTIYSLFNRINLVANLLMLCPLAGLTLLLGRRELIFYLFVAVFVVAATGQRFKLSRLAVLGVVALLLNFLVFPIFFQIRTSIVDLRANDVRLTNPFVLVMEAFKDRQIDPTDITSAEEYRRNTAGRMLESRDFTLSIVDAEHNRPAMHGTALTNSVLYAMPRYFRPPNVWGSTKGDVEEYMGLPIEDAAPTMATFFLADFGVIGGIFGGIFFGGVCNIYWILMVRSVKRNPLISLVLLGGIAYFIFSMEAELSLTFCLLRNLLIICAGLFIINQMVPLSRSEGAGSAAPPNGPRPGPGRPAPGRPPMPQRRPAQ